MKIKQPEKMVMRVFTLLPHFYINSSPYVFVMLNLTAVRQVLFQHLQNLTKEDSEINSE